MVTKNTVTTMDTATVAKPEMQSPLQLDLAKKSKLLALRAGIQLKRVVQKPPMVGEVQNLWRIYIQGNQNVSGVGFTGADIAVVHCHEGYCNLVFQGRKIPAGSPLEMIPDAEVLAADRAIFQYIKEPPTRDEYAQTFGKSKTANGNAETRIAEKLAAAEANEKSPDDLIREAIESEG